MNCFFSADCSLACGEHGDCAYEDADEGGDVVGFFVATVGKKIMREVKSLYDTDSYQDYLMLHGFAVELAEALAQCCHDDMRNELGLSRPVGLDGRSVGGQGERFSFGYPSCPDLAGQPPLFDLLRPSEIGVSLSDTLLMIPEASVSAMVVHHPHAGYFSV